MNKPTPTTHGAWRVVDSQLVDESRPASGSTQEVAVALRKALGLPETDADKPTPPATTSRKAPKSKE